MAAEQGVKGAQSLSGFIYATGGRSVPQNWTTAVKWWCKADVFGQKGSQWLIGCATTTGEAWFGTLHRRTSGSERLRRKEMKRLLELYRRESRETV